MSVEARNGSQRAGITPQIEQLPIFGIHKAIFLALRYRSSGDQVSSHVSDFVPSPTDFGDRLVEFNSN